VLFAFEEHGGVHEDFGDSGEGVLEAVVEKEIDEWILVGSLFVFVHGWCCFGLSTFSVRSWTDANNPGWSGEVGAPPHWQPIPLRSIGCQCGGLLQCRGLLQTNLYTTSAHADWIVTEDSHFKALIGSGFKPQPIKPGDFIARVLD
jgi:hypothetical protein